MTDRTKIAPEGAEVLATVARVLSPKVEIVKLFAPHGPRWMFAALLLVLGASVTLALVVVHGLSR